MKIKRRIISLLIIIILSVTVSPVIWPEHKANAYTEEQKEQAKAWLSSHGYSPTKEGAYKAYQDYKDGKFDKDSSDIDKSNTEMPGNEKKDSKESKKKDKKNKKKKNSKDKENNENKEYKENGINNNETPKENDSLEEQPSEDKSLQNKSAVPTITVNPQEKKLTDEKSTERLQPTDSKTTGAISDEAKSENNIENHDKEGYIPLIVLGFICLFALCSLLLIIKYRKNSNKYK